MTGADGQNFVRQIAEAYQALEREPELTRQIEMLNRVNAQQGEVITSRELRIIDLKNEIDGLRSTIRSLEVERDDHSFRHLEAQDAANVLANVLRTVQATVGEALAATEPQEPNLPPLQEAVEVHELTPAEQLIAELQDGDPITETNYIVPGSPGGTLMPPLEPLRREPSRRAEINVPELEGEREDPFAVNTVAAATPSTTADALEAKMDGEVGTSSAPFASSASIEPPNACSPTAPQDALPLGSSPVQPAEPDGPYKGKLYQLIPGYIEYRNWIDGGGSEEGFYWHRGLPIPAGHSA